ncbi:GAL4-like Zn(II)2Cys6 (or C6 zinc) binuclear cluster DNA-binding domain [Rhizoctonia solani]|uniref:GAL4-like Zn(II)2Cys6 (Or C6 zinc) binuclear cluster DNA-binding domain n=1 Tax=Rhizoctonia solani TaxID=456999 RepID=A0A8H7H9E3_9AGAM|nr:GAL4-like Zn(II)2Cys6 (or C6 zinc) binuclear cluster DNA-binding domain [Rhizoctonia solani]
MPPLLAPTRSTTGCFTCKIKRKKCDEAKPHCLRCQKSNIQCPGYVYVTNLNKPTRPRKLRTFPAPRTLAGQILLTTYQHILFPNPQQQKSQLRDQTSVRHQLAVSETPGNSLDAPPMMHDNTLSDDVDLSNPWVFLSSFSGSLQQTSNNLDSLLGVDPKPINPEPITTLPDISNDAPMTLGQASLLDALLGLEQPSNSTVQHPPNTGSPFDPNSTSTEDDNLISDDEDSEGVISIISRVPVLDKTAEGNALPYVLQSYATWIRRMAFDPIRMVRIARDFVFGQFAGGEESRWLVTLLADIGSRIANFEITDGTYDPAISILQNTVIRRLGTVRSIPSTNGSELVQALDAALETIMINFFVSPLSDVVALREEAAPIFGQLCPNTSISLPALFVHPLVCLRQYAHVDIFLSVVMDLPTMFLYDTVVGDSQTPGSSQLTFDVSGENGIQWLHGIPDPLVLLFAKFKSMREDGLIPSAEVVKYYEHEINNLQPFQSPSSDPILVIMRCLVHECWKQLFDYLHVKQALCGDSANTPRVRQVFKRFLKLMLRVKPGRFPDEFLILHFALVG